MKMSKQTRWILVLAGLLALALPAATAALNPPAGGDAFVGTWQAQFQGKPFVTVNLTMLEGNLSGTVSRASIQLDRNGELTGADTQEGTDAVSDARVSGQTLHFSTSDGQSATQYEMTLTGTD